MQPKGLRISVGNKVFVFNKVQPFGKMIAPDLVGADALVVIVFDCFKSNDGSIKMHPCKSALPGEVRRCHFFKMTVAAEVPIWFPRLITMIREAAGVAF
jgi:hypothetical protein